MNQPIEYEHCSECGNITGKAGRGDGSIYVELKRDYHRGGGDGNRPIEPAGTELGPLCLVCYHELSHLIDEDQ